MHPQLLGKQRRQPVAVVDRKRAALAAAASALTVRGGFVEELARSFAGGGNRIGARLIDQRAGDRHRQDRGAAADRQRGQQHQPDNSREQCRAQPDKERATHLSPAGERRVIGRRKPGAVARAAVERRLQRAAEMAPDAVLEVVAGSRPRVRHSASNQRAPTATWPISSS